jgi:Penicillin tolerance protein
VKNLVFVQGFSFTIKKASELLEQYGSLYCLGEIVHNERVVKSLEDKGMITVNNIDEIPDDY